MILMFQIGLIELLLVTLFEKSSVVLAQGHSFNVHSSVSDIVTKEVSITLHYILKLA